MIIKYLYYTCHTLVRSTFIITLVALRQTILWAWLRTEMLPVTSKKEEITRNKLTVLVHIYKPWCAIDSRWVYVSNLNLTETDSLSVKRRFEWSLRIVVAQWTRSRWIPVRREFETHKKNLVVALSGRHYPLLFTYWFKERIQALFHDLTIIR